ncbi:zinc ABC transporter substrate-binding protein [Facklamia sp. DSM 111018]|uniref:Zinc ABC transporter substrate-binding protein n=1 Tax=Facklamia lactis TaxID=2749967 RepID=A0ABS0LSF5_9LACT|nr:zinc ABC transporter substrate-binding protein [Facklamia lactis]MBG9981429.1 zinc ABC transporter substrate-binding protein [Facklamia lactis]MBG9987095.1 zinc ABC transporter substrate-binding protein [Facklamia lactis]
MKQIVKSAFLLALIIFAGCSILINKVSAADRPQVLTTFYPVYFMVQSIAGEEADVTMLLPSNQDVHSYDLSARDAVMVQESDLFVYQDDEMEIFVQELASIVDPAKTRLVESTKGLDLLEGEGGAHQEAHGGDHQHEIDPHTWLDPMLYAQQSENIMKALVEIDPDNAKKYEENYNELLENLKMLDKDYQEKLKELSNRTIVVQHGAFAYLANAYGLEQMAIAGLSSEQEPSAQQLGEMQKLLLEKNISVIYVDPALDSKIAETVASAAQVDLLPLRTIEIVTEEERKAGEDYFSIMRSNLDQLTKN